MPLPIFIYLKTSKRLVTSFEYDRHINKLCTSIRHVFPIGTRECICGEFKDRHAVEIKSQSRDIEAE